MRRGALLSLLVVGLLAPAVPCSAQGVGTSCDISGTWYGGSDPAFQYLWTLTPIGGGRYYSVAQTGFDARPFGYVYWTAWTGEAVKAGSRTFDSYAMSYWVWDPAAAEAAGVDGSLPEVDVVRSRLELVDCNTMTSTVDVYAVYLAFTAEKTPFVTPPDVDILNGATILETYHRMPTACPTCAATGGAAPAAALKVAPRGKKK